MYALSAEKHLNAQQNMLTKDTIKEQEKSFAPILVCEKQNRRIRMTDKEIKILSCTRKVEEILDIIRPGNDWEIAYDIPEHVPMSDWTKSYLGLIDGEDYFFIYVEGRLLYAVNVTGDSELTAIQELITKLSAKF